MIELRKGNLFEQYKYPCVIVHGANAQGVMGSGFAKQFKQEFPEAYQDYLFWEKHTLGDLIVTNYGKGLTVCSAITQEFYGRDPSKVYVDYNAVEKALTTLAKEVSITRDIYMPFIGGGLANGDRSILMKIFEKTFINRNVYLFTLD